MRLSDINLLSVGHTIQMAGAIYSGEGKTFLCFFPGESPEAETASLEMDQVEWETFIKQTDLLEVQALVKDKSGTISKAVVRKSTRQIEQGISWRVFKRDHYACRYCGNDDVPLTVDHLVLWEEGGPSTVENLVAACRKCNKTRGNLQYADWLQHPFYRKVSGSLKPEVRVSNEALVATLDKIPRHAQVRSR